MKITIEAVNDEGEKQDVAFVDDHMENDLFAEMFVGDKSYLVSISDLKAACVAFESKSSRRLEVEHLMHE